MTKSLLLAALALVALVAIACAEATPAPTPQPTATPTPRPAPTATPTPVPGVPTATPTATPRPTPTATGTPTATPVPKGFLGPGPTVRFTLAGQLHERIQSYLPVEVPVFGPGGLVEKRSNGRVKIQLLTQTAMGLTGTEIGRLVRQGVIPLSQTTLGYIGGEAPKVEGIDLPGLWESPPKIQAAVTAWNPVMADVMKEKFGAHNLGTWFNDSQIEFCKGDIKSITDWKGKKIRVFSTPLAELFDAMGMTPVTIAFAEVYSALERGVVDCAITGGSAGNGSKWYEVANTLVVLPAGWSVNAYFANLTWWNGLDADVRTFLQAIFDDEVIPRIFANSTKLDAGGVACNASQADCPDHPILTKAPARNAMKVYRPTEAEQRQVKEILNSVVLPRWVKRCGAGCASTFNQVLAPLAGIRAPE